MEHYRVINSKPSIMWVNSEFIEDRLSMDSFSDEYLKWKENCSLSSCFKMNKIKDIAKGVNIGFTSKRNYQTEGVKFLNISNVQQFNFKLEDVKFISKEVHESLKKSKLEYEDVLLTITGTIGDSVVVPREFGEANMSANIVAIRLNKLYDPYYLCTFFNSRYGKMQTKGSSKSNVWSNLGVQEVREIEVPIPSFEIQKYIGAKVRKAEKLREEAKMLKKEAEELLNNSILQLDNQIKKCNREKWVSSDILLVERLEPEYYKDEYLYAEEIIKNNKNYYLGEIIEEIQDGPGGWSISTNDYVEFGVPIIRGVNIGDDGEFINAGFVYITEEKNNELKKTQVTSEQVLITVRGTVGRAAVMPEYLKMANLNAAVVRIKVKNEIIDPYYLAGFFNSYIGRLQTSRIANGAVQLNMNLTECKSNLIPVPDKEKQIRYREKIEYYLYAKEKSKMLVEQAKQDVEDLIEGNFDMSKIKETN